jgi:hypothetical protein
VPPGVVDCSTQHGALACNTTLTVPDGSAYVAPDESELTAVKMAGAAVVVVDDVVDFVFLDETVDELVAE